MRFVLALIAALSVLSCGGGDSGGSGDGGGDTQGSLTLRGGNYTEEEFRTEIRSLLSTVDSDIICASLEGLSGRQVADALAVVSEQQGVTPFRTLTRTMRHEQARYSWKSATAPILSGNPHHFRACSGRQAWRPHISSGSAIAAMVATVSSNMSNLSTMFMRAR